MINCYSADPKYIFNGKLDFVTSNISKDESVYSKGS